MGILDGIVGWIAEQVMHGLDMISTSVLGALGCDMSVFMRYFPAAETMCGVFVALGIGIILLNWVWQLFKNFGHRRRRCDCAYPDAGSQGRQLSEGAPAPAHGRAV
jgi:uncharacterized membrane protein YeaQ/YmgE (transglycosylase-associated protein family)